MCENRVNCNQNDSRDRLLSRVINRSRSPRRIGKSGRVSAARNGRRTLRTWWKSALSFLPVECSSIRRSRAVLFYPLSQFLPSPALPAGTATGGRRERFISTPVAIIPFVSQPASHGSRRRAFSLTFSLFTISPALHAPLRGSLSTAHPRSRLDRWTNRAASVISTYPQVRLIRPADVFIHPNALPL